MRTKTISIILGAVILVGGFVGYRYYTRTGYIGSSLESQYEFTTVQRNNLIQEVSASGKVAPPTTIDLQFKNSGKLTVLKAEVGDKTVTGQLLAKQDISVLEAQLAEMRAGIDIGKAKLEQLLAGASPEDILGAETAVESAKQNLIDKVQDAYTKSDDAVRSKTDKMFVSPLTQSYTLSFSISSDQSISNIQNNRQSLENVLTSWGTSLNRLTISDDLKSFLGAAKDNLNRVKSYLDEAAQVVNKAMAGATLSQATIDAWKTDISTGRANINTAIVNLTAAEEKLKTAENNLAVKRAPARSPDVALYEAQIRQAEAQMQKIQAQIQEMILISPVSGEITEVNGNVGEIVKSDVVVVRIIPTGVLQVDVNISEADVVGVKVGQEAKITLDAFDDQVSWRGKVTHIDPAETVIGGAIYYNTTVLFVDRDVRIKPGMTANVWIEIAHKEKALSIPLGAIREKRGEKPIDSRLYPYVEVLEKDQIREKEVQTGIKGKGGMIEIISGLNEGEKIILSVKRK